jgi:methionyl-tRNA formyltransferase
MQMDEGLDTGPVYTRHELPIQADDDAGSLTVKLGQLSAEVVATDLQAVVGGQISSVPQDSARVTWAPPIKHDDQILDFTLPAAQISGKIRGLSPKPGAFTTLRGRRLKLLQVRRSDEPVSGPPGTVKLSKRSIWIATGEGSLEVLRLQPEGKGVQQPSDVINGRGISDGDHLG